MNKKEIKKEYKEALLPHKKNFRAQKSEYKRHKLNLLRKKREGLRAISRSPDHPNNPPKRKTIDEIGNAVTHGIGAILSPAALVVMLLNSDKAADYIGAIIYFLGLFLMFLSSCLYHSFAHGSTVKRLFHRFDYCAIYLLIGATFAPILLSYIGGAVGIIFFCVQWVIIITAVTMISIFGPLKLRKFNTPLFLVLGWSGILLMPALIKHGISFALWIVGGGAVYSLGVIPFAIKRGPAHFIWHLFVLAGSAIQFVGILINIYL